MPTRLAALTLLTLLPALAQSPLSATTFGGSGDDSIRGMAVDASGNIWVVGTTFSADLPLLNAFQTINRGTQVVFSSDAGATWNPLSTPQPNANIEQPATMVVDPTNSSTLYVGSGSNVCKSIDAGRHFNCVTLPGLAANLTSLAIDPRTPATVYASLTNSGGVYKSTDGGQTWTNSSSGLPSPYVDSVVIDPFHSNVLFAWVGSGGYVSNDGAASWQPSSLPWPSGDMFTGLRFSFDPVTPGTIYGPGFAVSGIFIQKSTDGGNSWTALNAPFVGCCVVADPKVAGVLYGGEGSLAFWKSTDGGATWASSTLGGGIVGSIAVDPANPQIILAGQYRSTDGGNTWSPTNVSRSLQPMFAPSAASTAFAVAPTTSDAFVAEFQPDGKTLVFASYFGGTDNETGNAIAIDNAGNVWIAGSTSSSDMPVIGGAFQSGLKGSTNGFVAKISSVGKLLAATYLGGSKSDAALGIAVGPQGNPWIIGSWTSTDFPFTTGPPPLIPIGPQGGVLSELDSVAGQLLYSTPENGTFDLNGKGIAIDPAGNVIVTGSAGGKAFVLKVDPNGQQIYQQSFGGSQTPPFTGSGGFLPSFESPNTLGVAVVTDQAGNAYIAGSTSTSDFPVTPNAAQTTIGSGCPYPAFTTNTGLIGVIGFNLIDDSFVMKLGPDGTVAYATFVGGSCYDHPTGIAVDGNGNVSIAGETDSYDYPLLSAVAAAPAYRQFASFLSSINASGSALTFSSYLYAGSSPSVVTSGGVIYISGSTGGGAQSQPDSGAYTPLPVYARDVYLGVLHPPTSAPALNLTQVFNWFSLLPGPVAPGEIVSIGVSGFVPAQSMDIGLYPQGPLTTNLGGVSVNFDGIPAYIMSISNGRIVCIAPFEISGQSSTAVQVNANGSASNVLSVSVAATALGLLSLDRSGKGLADAQNPDGTLNGPTNPAPRAAAVTIFFTGGGVTNPPQTDGVIPATTAIVPAAPVSSYCASVHALPGFVPGIFACDYPTPSNPGGPQYSVSLGTSQELLIYVK